MLRYLLFPLATRPMAPLSPMMAAFVAEAAHACIFRSISPIVYDLSPRLILDGTRGRRYAAIYLMSFI